MPHLLREHSCDTASPMLRLSTDIWQNDRSIDGNPLLEGEATITISRNLRKTIKARICRPRYRRISSCSMTRVCDTGDALDVARHAACHLFHAECQVSCPLERVRRHPPACAVPPSIAPPRQMAPSWTESFPTEASPILNTTPIPSADPHPSRSRTAEAGLTCRTRYATFVLDTMITAPTLATGFFLYTAVVPTFKHLNSGHVAAMRTYAASSRTNGRNELRASMRSAENAYRDAKRSQAVTMVVQACHREEIAHVRRS